MGKLPNVFLHISAKVDTFAKTYINLEIKTMIELFTSYNITNMKGFMKTMIIAFITTMLFMGGSNWGYAQKKTAKQQKSLVTQSMAHKIANLALNNQGRIRYIFYEANNLSDLRTAKTILYSIDEHPEYIENFIVAIFNTYGTGNGGFLAFDDIGFTPAEYDIAEKIYNNIQAKEKEKSIKLEQAIYDAYVKDGFPQNIRKKSNYKPAKFVIDEKSLAKYINRLGFRESCINATYEVNTDSHGVIKVYPNDELIAASNISLSSIPRVEFENIGKILNVPSKYTLTVEEKREKALSDKIVNIVWDKRTQQWTLESLNDFKEDVGEKTFRSVTSDLHYTLNNLPELKDGKKKKHTISVTAYINGVVRCHLDGYETKERTLQPYIFIKVIK